MTTSSGPKPDEIIERAHALRAKLSGSLHDRTVAAMYSHAERITQAAVSTTGRPRVNWDLLADRILTSRWFGFPLMFMMLAVVLWMTIAGANTPSALLFSALFWLHDKLELWFTAAGAPGWLTGFLVHGVYRGLAWVVAVMLPPMAIFFPIFTLLEDVGYLPRVAFNLDRLFRWAGAHGKQALTMSMGFGCNAAGVVSCRVIESPRERLLAILTNNFMLCNGRWPTIILVSTIFVGAAVPPRWAGLVVTACVAGVCLLGVLVTFIVCKVLSNTVLKGEASHFYLELPPYRRPAILRVIYRSIIDRTISVLGRACVVAAPAGGVIYLLGAIHVGDQSLMQILSIWLEPIGWVMGIDGVILLAFLIAIPANEIVVPTMIMGYLAATQMTEFDDISQTAALFHAHNWTLMTAVCLMLFSLLHYPCSTATWTIYRETGSVKWTLWANLMPLSIAIVTCTAVAGVWRLVT